MEKYHISIRILHWVIGVLLIAILTLGILMKYYFAPPFKYELYAIHKALGVTILVLLLVRLFVRLTTKIPEMPSGISGIERVAARLVHYSLYIITFIVAISGYVMSSASGRGITWFNLFDVPLLIEKNAEITKTAHGIHEILPYILIALIALHILATVKHVFINKINILKRMV